MEEQRNLIKEEVSFHQKFSSEKIFIKKTLWLILAAFLMAWAQSILSYTHQIGMAPIDTFTQGLAFLLNSNYAIINYITVTFLVIAAIFLAKPKDRLITATAFITGYLLAIIVNFFIIAIVSHFPGLILTDGNNGELDKSYANYYLIGFAWFLLGYLCLITSIGIWINVGIGMRPYDIMLVRMSERFSRFGYVFYRNLFDLILVVIAAILTSLAAIIYDENVFDLLPIGPGTVIIVCCTGFLTNRLQKFFARFI